MFGRLRLPALWVLRDRMKEPKELFTVGYEAGMRVPTSSLAGLPLLNDRAYVANYLIEVGQFLNLMSETFVPCSPEAFSSGKERWDGGVPIPCPMTKRQDLERHASLGQGEPDIEEIPRFVAFIEHPPLATEDLGERKHRDGKIIRQIRVGEP
jgi:hypothetical protein